MSKKIALLSTLMLVFGGIAIPGGFFINGIIDNMVTDRVDDGLLGIEEQFIPIAEDMILEMGPAIALPLIQQQALPIIEEMVSQMGPAIALDLIRENSLPIIEELVKQMGPAIALPLIEENSLPLIEEIVYQLGVAIALPLIEANSIPIIEEIVSQIGPAIALPLIQENSQPLIEEMVYQIGPAIALEMIREEAVPIIEQEINVIGPAIALQIIKELAVPAGIPLVYASFLDQLLYNAYEKGEDRTMLSISGGDCLLNMFFDRVTVNLGLLGGGTTSFSAELKAENIPYAGGEYIYGISEWLGSDLNIGDYSAPIGLYPSPKPNDWLAWGQSTPIWPGSAYNEVNNPPGFMQHTEKGFGVLEFLENYTIAEEIGTTAAYNAFLDPYEVGEQSITFSKMGVVHDYFYEYWIPDAMPLLLADLQNPTTPFAGYAPEYVYMDLDDIAYYEFLKQWTSYSTYSQGFDFHDVVDSLPAGTKGLEVDSPTISNSSMYALWDETNEWSFLNLTGIKKWHDAYSDGDDKDFLESQFGLTSQEAQDILDWLWAPGGFAEETFPLLAAAPAPYGYGATIEELSWQAFYELWANGTALGLSLYPAGMDFGEFMPGDFSIGTTGFEVGIPNATGISRQICEDLWNEDDVQSLLNIDGIGLWFEANSDVIVKEDLKTYFGLDDPQINAILAWLWEGPDSFSQGLLPTLINSSLGYDMPIPELASLILLEQWANGTALGLPLYSGGLDFGEFIPGEFPLGTTGFEVGIPVSTGMSKAMIEALWNADNDQSLTNIDGIGLWYQADSNVTIKDSLRTTFGLNNTQINAILAWLWDGPDCFSQDLLPTLINSSLGYGIEIPALAHEILNELWANGTALGLSLYPGGMDFGEFMPDEFPTGTTGFQVGYPISTGMTNTVIEALWNEDNDQSLTNIDGIGLWYQADSNDTVKDNLKTTFGLNDTQIDAILAWLWDGPDCFSQDLLPTLINSSLGYGMEIPALAHVIFYELWANGTALGLSLYPGGMDFGEFMPDEFPTGTTGFEVGFPVATGMSIEMCEALWDAGNIKSLTNIDGIGLWFEAYSNDTVKDDLKTTFGLNDTQINAILTWLWDGPDCFSQDLLPALIGSSLGFGVEISELSKYVIYEQWANGTILGMSLYPSGWDFGEFMPAYFLEGTTGFEVGIPNAINVTLDILKALWDENNASSILHVEGIGLWFGANSSDTVKDELKITFGLNESQINAILTWLWVGPDCFSQDLLPTLIDSELGYGMDIPSLSEILLFEQWANGTFMERIMYPLGLDFGEFMPEDFEIGTTGFEVGIPEAIELTIDQIRNLWDIYNENSLTNMTGIEKWLDAYTNDVIKASLTSIFGLTSQQTNMILDWLWDGPDSFSQGLLPKLLESELGYGMSLTEFAKLLMLEQWANGTIMGMTMFEGGIDFHDFIPSLPVGSTGFEVGVPIPTGMSQESALLLWDTSNPYSLVKDISVWWSISSKDSENYDTVRDANKLDDATMEMILKWLPEFKTNLMPALAQYEMGLPMDTTNLGNTIQIGGIIIGAMAIGLASTGIVSNRVVSKKKKSITSVDKTVNKFDKVIENLNTVSRELQEELDLEETSPDSDPKINNEE